MNKNTDPPLQAYDVEKGKTSRSDWQSLSLDEDDIKERIKEYVRLVPLPPDDFLPALSLAFPLAGILSAELDYCETALSLVVEAEKCRKNGFPVVETNLSDFHELVVAGRSDPVFAFYLALVAFLAALLDAILDTGDRVFWMGEWACCCFKYIAIWSWCLFVVTPMEMRNGTLKTASVGGAAAIAVALLQFTVAPDVFFGEQSGGHAYDPFLNLYAAITGLGFAEVFVNWDIMTITVKRTTITRVAFTCVALLLNFWFLVPLGVFPAFFFGFCLALPFTAHLKSSMGPVLGKPCSTYLLCQSVVCWVCFLTVVVPVSICLSMLLNLPMDRISFAYLATREHVK